MLRTSPHQMQIQENLELDPLDEAINTEFVLWRQAEEQRFRAELTRAGTQRIEAIREGFVKKTAELSAEKREREKKAISLVEEYQQQILKAQMKLQSLVDEQNSTRQAITAIAQQVKTQLQQTEREAASKLAQVESLAIQHQAKAEQAQAQAAFYQAELAAIEKRAVMEAQKFQQLLLSQQKTPAAKLRTDILAKQESLNQYAQKAAELLEETLDLQQKLEDTVRKLQQ